AGYVQADQAEFVHPRQEFIDDTLRRDGQFPLWEPLTFAGQPFFAANGSRLAYPPFLVLSLLFDPTWTQDLHLTFHLFAAGLAMFALLKTLGARFGGAMLAGVSWAFSSYVMAWALFGAIPVVAALLPVAVLLVRRAHDRRSWRLGLAASAVLALLYLGTSVELAFLSYLLVFGYAACLALWRLVLDRRSTSALQKIALLAAPGVLVGVAVLLAAVAVIPFLDLSSQSTRVASPYSVLRQAWPTELGHLLRAFVPPDAPLTVPTLINQQVFVGTATGVLAVVGFFLRRPGTALGRCIVVVTALYVLGTPVTWVGYHLVPGLKGLTGFGRSLFLWDFGLALLGGLGLDAVLGALRRHGSLAPQARNRRRVLCGAVAGVCILATATQLLVYGRHVNPPFQPRDARFLYPSTPSTEVIRAALGRVPGGGRMLPVNRVNAPSRPDLFARALPGAVGSALGLAVAGGYDTLLAPRALALWKVVEGNPLAVATAPSPGSYYTRYFPGAVRTDLLARVGVAAVVTPPEVPETVSLVPEDIADGDLQKVYGGPDLAVYRVPDALPRAFVVDEVSWAPTADAALRRFTESTFDARRQVILEGPPADEEDFSDAARGGQVPPSVVEWQENSPNELRLSVSARRPGWLVLLDTWDPGWRATVAGR
ncbi:MAG TPA: hypothetical protein VHF91_09150, partial [Acidimicrobiales bacterium]|nr:hypothetical protein [Acidimicrobiales bacterium]